MEAKGSNRSSHARVFLLTNFLKSLVELVCYSSLSLPPPFPHSFIFSLFPNYGRHLRPKDFTARGFPLVNFFEIATFFPSPFPPSSPFSPFPSLTFLSVQGLGAVHVAGVMHKDLNPTNIVVNMETKALNIIDFGLASQMHRSEVHINEKN